jgi:hypothetical protein
MSVLYPVIEIEYKNRKPSKAVVMRTIGEYLKQGAKAFTITWGENWIDLTYHDKYRQWYGEGWIRDISGQDIGEELNSIRKQALEEIKTLNLWNT